jgi:hypothetical protein
VTVRWPVGTSVVRREVLHGHPWVGFATRVVRDDEDLLAVYLSPGSRLAYPDWPFDRWEHPWRTAGFTQWRGHGKLMLHRPGDAYSVDLFWRGPARAFAGWYLNLQDPFRRHLGGFDTLDHELDYWQPADGPWQVKDAELFEQRVAEGRYSPAQAAGIRTTGTDLERLLTSGATWWDPSWAAWTPPDGWGPLDLPADWSTAG